jgi:hypothetical protein
MTSLSPPPARARPAIWTGSIAAGSSSAPTYRPDSVNTGLDFTFGKRKRKLYALDLEPRKYDVWLDTRFGKRSETLRLDV